MAGLEGADLLEYLKADCEELENGVKAVQVKWSEEAEYALTHHVEAKVCV